MKPNYRREVRIVLLMADLANTSGAAKAAVRKKLRCDQYWENTANTVEPTKTKAGFEDGTRKRDMGR